MRKRLPKPKFHRDIEIADSSWIREVAYDPENEVLDLTTTTYRYRYRDVSPTVFALLVTSGSVGKVYNTHLRHREALRLPLTEKTDRA